jgi:homoserine dehydrogenase
VLSIGLLGLGNVGAAVVRAASRAEATLAARGLRVRVQAALVRDRSRLRPEHVQVPFVTDSVSQFFALRHDVVVEVLGGVQPAADLVARALRSVTPVVTANKSMLAAEGRRLAALARDGGTSLLFEAAVIAGLPFLHALGHRPLASAIDGVEAILNGTTNFILTQMAEERVSFETALGRAQRLGYAEPHAEHDVSGRDAAEKLCVLLRHLGLADLEVNAIPQVSLRTITPDDLERARARGETVKFIARARRAGQRFDTFVGPVLLSADHPLSRVRGVLNGILLEGSFAGPLFYSGPGAGPEVTAATILDDVASLAQVDARCRSEVKCP